LFFVRDLHSGSKRLFTLPVRPEQVFVQRRSELCLRILLSENIELIFRPVELPCKAEQLEEKRAEPKVGRLLPQLRTKRCDCFCEAAGLEV
jgi:hypothetical protein